jgi:hypothetical protein
VLFGSRYRHGIAKREGTYEPWRCQSFTSGAHAYVEIYDDQVVAAREFIHVSRITRNRSSCMHKHLHQRLLMQPKSAPNVQADVSHPAHDLEIVYSVLVPHGALFKPNSWELLRKVFYVLAQLYNTLWQLG